MTILTKPFSEKKGDKAVAPLVLNGEVTPPTAPDDVEAQFPINRILIFPHGVDGQRRVFNATTLCLLLTALTVVGIGIVGGKMLYEQYLKVDKFEGSANIPLKDAYYETELNDDRNDADVLVDKLFPTENYPADMWSDDEAEFKKMFLKDFFQESFEISDDEKYEKINVPDFRDGRSGRFIHDFNTNTTGIIDLTGNRCFVMPLNREDVLPPQSLFDLIHKMWEGYYKVDTNLVRRNMRVIVPPVSDTKSIGGYIANECEGRPIYRLEKYVGGVVKRSAELHSEAKFAQYAGQKITQIDIMNLDDVLAYEKGLNSQ